MLNGVRAIEQPVEEYKLHSRAAKKASKEKTNKDYDDGRRMHCCVYSAIVFYVVLIIYIFFDLKYDFGIIK